MDGLVLGAGLGMRDGLGLGLSVGAPVSSHGTQLNESEDDSEELVRPWL